MKRRSLCSRLVLALKTALRYWCQHGESLAAMDAAYGKQWRDENGDQLSVELKICPYGNFYLVSQLFYRNGLYQREDCWLATYGWHSNGHLISLKRHSYLIFDPQLKTLQIEDYPDDGPLTLEVYHQI